MRFQSIVLVVASAVTAVNASTIAWCIKGNLACASACRLTGYDCVLNPVVSGEYCCVGPWSSHEAVEYVCYLLLVSQTLTSFANQALCVCCFQVGEWEDLLYLVLNLKAWKPNWRLCWYRGGFEIEISLADPNWIAISYVPDRTIRGDIHVYLHLLAINDTYYSYVPWMVL